MSCWELPLPDCDVLYTESIPFILDRSPRFPILFQHRKKTQPEHKRKPATSQLLSTNTHLEIYHESVICSVPSFLEVGDFNSWTLFFGDGEKKTRKIRPLKVAVAWLRDLHPRVLGDIRVTSPFFLKNHLVVSYSYL